MTLTVGSLFSGIGGLDLGLERAGMEVIWQSEIDPYGCRVLKKHWPEVVNHGNIKDINWGDVVRPDIICGGYPCQPFSTAGKRQGTDDPRHLWPWVREAISELRPRYAILENVRGHVSLGLSTVLGEMASIGYDAEWQIVSAASVGAPHRRDRVIIVAYPNGGRLKECESETEQTPGVSLSSQRVFTTDRWLNALRLIGTGRPDVANTNGQRRDIGWVNNETRFIGSGGEEGHDVANTAQQHSNGEPDYTRDSARPEKVSQSRDSSGAQNVANTDDSGSRTSGSRTHRDRTKEVERWDNESQSRTSGRSADVANTDGGNAPDGRQRESIQSQDSSGRDDGSGSGSDTRQVSMGSTRQDSGDVANTDDNGSSSTTLGGSVRTPTDEQSSRQDNSTDTQGRSGISREMANTDTWETSGRLGSVPTDSGQVRERRDHARGEESHASREWWQVEPDVGRVAHGIPSRVDRLRGLGNAVVPQVAELVGRMVMSHYEETK